MLKKYKHGPDLAIKQAEMRERWRPKSYQSERYWMLVEHGLCTNCKDTATVGKLCERCHAKEIERQRARKLRLSGTKSTGGKTDE